MPNSKTRPQALWNIYDPEEILAEGSETRRRVKIYKELHNIDIPTALAALVEAGYQQLVSRVEPSQSSGPNPRGATDGSRTSEA